MPRNKSILKFDNKQKEVNSQNILKNDEDQLNQLTFMKDIEIMCFVGINYGYSIFKTIITRVNRLLTFQKFESLFKDFSNFARKVFEMRLSNVSRTCKGLSFFIKKITVQTLRECTRKLKSNMFNFKKESSNGCSQESISQSDLSKPCLNKTNNKYLFQGKNFNLDNELKMSLIFEHRRYNNKEKLNKRKLYLDKLYIYSYIKLCFSYFSYFQKLI
jgi:hypothetical protein